MTTSKKHYAAPPSDDAIAALIADHKKVKGLFAAFDALKEESASGREKAAIVRQVCGELTVHAALEEEIFYPAVRKAIGEDDLMDEALVEHAGAKELIQQLGEMDPKDSLYDAKMKVLGEQIEHHVKEEEGEMFPAARRAKLDVATLGATMAARKAALMAQMQTPPPEKVDDGREHAPARKSGTR